MLWRSLPPRYRAVLFRAWLTLAVAAGVCVLADLPRAQPITPFVVPAAVEQATPESLSPPAPYSPAWMRKQHLARLGVDRWHAAGQRGRGIKIAVLDSGFRGYRAFLGKALPARVTVRSFREDGNIEAKDSQHGILCAEVLHALAPEAELLLANWEPDRPERFLEAVRWAREQGARIISCSLIMPSWSDGEGGGAVNEAMLRLLGDGKGVGDVLCFASAGNIAQRHWHGAYRPDTAGFHQWRKGSTGNLLTPWGNERVSVELYGPSAGAYELTVCEASSGEEVGRGVVRPAGRGRTGATCVVRFTPVLYHKYLVKVRALPTAKTPGPFHLVTLGGGLGHSMSRGSISCPADGRAVHAVGAVDTEGRRLFYSSCGPNSKVPKPDFVAEVPFPSLWRERPFAGTSAAAPQAAGLAALWWSRHCDWTAEQVATAMRSAARDLGPPGHDFETGHGCVALP